jgi:hypothetical protein
MTVTFNNMVYGSFVYRAPSIPGVYNLTLGTKAPVYGTGPGAYPPSGWTGLINVSADDFFTIVPNFPFTFYHSGVAAANVYVGSNSYLTYGGGSNVFNGLTSSNPALPKYFLGASDNSFQRVSYFTSSTNYVRLRYEGTAGTGGTEGGVGENPVGGFWWLAIISPKASLPSVGLSPIKRSAIKASKGSASWLG